MLPHLRLQRYWCTVTWHLALERLQRAATIREARSYVLIVRGLWVMREFFSLCITLMRYSCDTSIERKKYEAGWLPL